MNAASTVASLWSAQQHDMEGGVFSTYAAIRFSFDSIKSFRWKCFYLSDLHVDQIAALFGCIANMVDDWKLQCIGGCYEHELSRHHSN